MANFDNPQIMCKGLVYVKPKLAEYTFVQMMDTETYLLKLMGSSALREGIIKHLITLNRLMSNPSCELFPQLRLDFDLIEVSGGKFFQISKRKFIDCPLEAKEFGKVSPRMSVPFDAGAPPQPNISRTQSWILFQKTKSVPTS